MTPIPTSLVSVVVQGPVGPATARCIDGVRRHLAGAELVLSTWDGTDTSRLDVDVVVTSPDPGGTPTWITSTMPGPPNNTNRMVVSTFAGLRSAGRPFTVKIRTDATVHHAGATLLLADLAPVRGEWALFEHEVVVSSVYTRHPLKTPSGAFHPADTVQLGRTSDLLRLWDVALMTDDEASWFPMDGRPHWAATGVRYYPEQHVFLAALRQRYTVEYADRAVMSDEVYAASNRAIAQNFVVAEPWRIGITTPRLDQNLRWSEDPSCVMTEPIWRAVRTATEMEPGQRPWDEVVSA